MLRGWDTIVTIVSMMIPNDINRDDSSFLWQKYFYQGKEQHYNIRSPLMMTLDWSVEMLGCECNLIELCIHLNITKVAIKTFLIY